MNKRYYKFVIIDENMLCIEYKDSMDLEIMTTLSGSASSCINGTYPKPYNNKRIRDAKLSDLETFRLSYKGYDSDPLCKKLV